MCNNDVIQSKLTLDIKTRIITNWIKYSCLLAAPFIVLVLVNEISRMNLDETSHKFKGYTTINSANHIKTKCTWACHYNTDFCKTNHVKIDPSWFPITDEAYFGVIDALESTKSYNLVNVLLFLIGIPLFMWLLLVQILRMQTEIKQKKDKPHD